MQDSHGKTVWVGHMDQTESLSLWISDSRIVNHPQMVRKPWLSLSDLIFAVGYVTFVLITVQDSVVKVATVA